MMLLTDMVFNNAELIILENFYRCTSFQVVGAASMALFSPLSLGGFISTVSCQEAASAAAAYTSSG